MIERLELLSWATPLLTLDIMCSKGTYIRSLARDLGEALGLRRTPSGTATNGCWGVSDSKMRLPLDAVTGWQGDKRQGDKETRRPASSGLFFASPDLLVSLSEALLPPEIAVADWPIVALSAEAARQVRNGWRSNCRALVRPCSRAWPEGDLLALLERASDLWKPVKVFDWN